MEKFPNVPLPGENEVKKLLSLACCRHENAIFSPHIHRTCGNRTLAHPCTLRGHSQMTSAERGREGGYPNSDAVREVA